MNKCNNCHRDIPANWEFPCCPYCGMDLLKVSNESSANVNIGDANAFAGDVQIDSHNVINITNIEREWLRLMVLLLFLIPLHSFLCGRIDVCQGVYLCGKKIDVTWRLYLPFYGFLKFSFNFSSMFLFVYVMPGVVYSHLILIFLLISYIFHAITKLGLKWTKLHCRNLYTFAKA